MLGRLLAREHPVKAGHRCPVPIRPCPRRRLRARIQNPVSHGPDPQPLHRRTFHRALASHSQFRRQAEAQSHPRLIEESAWCSDDSIVRGTTPEDRRMVREVGAKKVHVPSVARPTISPCYYGGHAHARRVDPSSNSRRNLQILAPIRWAIFRFPRCGSVVIPKRFCTSCYTGVYPTIWVQLEVREARPTEKIGEPKSSNGSETVPAERPVVVN